jgi:hypothetical protein
MPLIRVKSGPRGKRALSRGKRDPSRGKRALRQKQKRPTLEAKETCEMDDDAGQNSPLRVKGVILLKE